MKTLTGNEVHDDMDVSDPSRKYKNLEFLEDRPIYRLISHYMGEDQELCWACGWNTYNQKNSSYGPRIRVMHTRANSGIWAIGTRWILRDQPNDRYLGNNYMTLKFLHQQRPNLTIPIPQEVQSLSQPTDPVYFTLESRVPGVTLMEVWDDLSRKEKRSYSRQLADVIRQLRQFTAPRPQKIDGSKLDDVILGMCHNEAPGNCFKIGSTVDEWLDDILGADLRLGVGKLLKTTDPKVIEEKFQEMKANFPACEPYVLTHADLNMANIIVKDGKIQGIIDWERAGYYPWWMEQSVCFRLCEWDDNAMELFGPVWRELEPELNFNQFEKLILEKIYPLKRAWNNVSHDHPRDAHVWWKPSFCKCKPVQGEFRAWEWGMPLTCVIDQLTPEQEALLEGYKRKDPWAQEQGEGLETTARAEDESK